MTPLPATAFFFCGCQLVRRFFFAPDARLLAPPLLALCVAHFAPGERLSPFVHMFLRRHRKKRFTKVLYATEYRERNEGRLPAHRVPGPDRLLDVARAFC